VKSAVSTVTRQPAPPARVETHRVIPSTEAQAISSAPLAIARLQRAVGNRTVARLIAQGVDPVARRAHQAVVQRKCAECEKEHDTIQPKLAVGPADDEYEREADRVAEHVMRMPDPVSRALQRTPAIVQRVCKECEEEDKKLQGKAVGGEGLHVSPAVESQIASLKGAGHPLPASARSYFEPRFGQDFGRVRVHTGPRAAEAAHSIGALAFTVGRDVAFAAGRYAPETSAGRRLLAHELTHVVQQGAVGHAPAGVVQRACEVTAPPGDLGCHAATTSIGTGTNILFGLDSPALSSADRGNVSAIAAAWHSGGRVAVLRIDGFASCDGPADRNWRLSCRRAQAVAAELEAPSDGSPGVDNDHIEIFASGETDQFSASALPPNRRAVITSGGTPPPGPACSLTVTGPDEVDHYCAAYVPSDAVTCGVFPAPNVTLTAGGAAAGAVLRWNITRGTSRASIVGTATGPSVAIKGDAVSGAQGDVTVQVTDGKCSTTHGMTVREPSSMTSSPTPTSGPTFVQTVVTYTVRDQFGNPMGANICWDETVTVCRSSTAFKFGDAPTDAAGQVRDFLNFTRPAGVPASLCIKLDQVITAGGCGPLQHNVILIRAAGVTVTPGASCAPGDPCP
jgi:outer membrane protein OmpA-like peptidoglycan-associated protein